VHVRNGMKWRVPRGSRSGSTEGWARVANQVTMNTRRFEELFYRFSLRPSLFICERFSRHSLAILPPFRRNSSAFQIHFVALSRDFYRKFSALHGSLKASVPYPGWVRGLGHRTHTTQKYNILPQSTTSDFARRA